jgi:sodium pump decarboxylase gamma subunit
MGDLFSGVFLMMVGMGTVFLFLVLLILVTEGIRIVWGEKPLPVTPAAASRPPGEDEALRAAVVTAALLHHRRRRP